MTLKTRSSKVELSEIETFPYTTFLKSCVIKNIERYYRIRIFLETFCCEGEYYSSTVRRNQLSPPVTWNLEINLKATRISTEFSVTVESSFLLLNKSLRNFFSSNEHVFFNHRGFKKQFKSHFFENQNGIKFNKAQKPHPLGGCTLW